MWTTSSVVQGALVMVAALLGSGSCQVSPPVKAEIGVVVDPFDISQVVIDEGRWQQNQNRSLSYLKFLDLDRLLRNYRETHKLSTKGAPQNGGWDSPTFPFRTHMQGHVLSAWAQCYASLKDTNCRDRATSFVAELLKCQQNNAAAGFSTGYLSGFPESEFAALEEGTLRNGNVAYYVIHKMMQGLLDVWRQMGDDNAKTVLLGMAGWVDGRTGKLSYSQMQRALGYEFGGMGDVLADIYRQTGDKRWLTVAQRFDHAAAFDFLAANQDQLNGNHANCNIPKWLGAAREYLMTGTSRYLDIARNAYNMVAKAHTYAIGGPSQNERFGPPNAIAGHLTADTAEFCPSYNMLKLAKQLWRINSSVTYIDFYERALINHLLGAQLPSSEHGHITYFTSLNPGGHKGLGPVWGGGTWSNDYDTFWCCQGTALEQNTRLMDVIYGHDASDLYLNLFAPSTLNWTEKGIQIKQASNVPVGDTSNYTINGGNATFGVKVRVPGWNVGSVEIKINGEAQTVSATAGSYAAIPSRNWTAGDVLSVKLGLALHLIAANDNPSLAAVAYGPAVLAGDFGSASLNSAPTLQLGSIARSGNPSTLAFTGQTSDGKTVKMAPFYDTFGVNYVVYWGISGSLPAKT